VSLQDAADLDANDATAVLEYLGKVVSRLFYCFKICHLRMYLFTTATLWGYYQGSGSRSIRSLLDEIMRNLNVSCWKVQDLIAEAADEDVRPDPMLPLVRLRVSIFMTLFFSYFCFDTLSVEFVLLGILGLL